MGQITNHMSVDAQNLMSAMQWFHFIWAIPYLVSVVPYLAHIITLLVNVIPYLASVIPCLAHVIACLISTDLCALFEIFYVVLKL